MVHVKFKQERLLRFYCPQAFLSLDFQCGDMSTVARDVQSHDLAKVTATAN